MYKEKLIYKAIIDYSVPVIASYYNICQYRGVQVYTRKNRKLLVITSVALPLVLAFGIFTFSYYTNNDKNKPQNTAAQTPQQESAQEKIDPQIQKVFDMSDLLFEAKVISLDRVSNTLVVLPLSDANQVSLTMNENTVVYQQPNSPQAEFKLYPVAELKDNMMVLIYGKTIDDPVQGIGVRVFPEITPNSGHMHRMP